jgi:Arc/MetJ-type ribon-helix-helix transcriptional regulator
VRAAVSVAAHARRFREINEDERLVSDVTLLSMMYTPLVKRLQISIPEDMDEALAVEAGRRRVSKAAVIRELLRQLLGDREKSSDPMAKLIGDIDAEPADIDEVVYGR